MLDWLAQLQPDCCLCDYAGQSGRSNLTDSANAAAQSGLVAQPFVQEDISCKVPRPGPPLSFEGLALGRLLVSSHKAQLPMPDPSAQQTIPACSALQCWHTINGRTGTPCTACQQQLDPELALRPCLPQPLQVNAVLAPPKGHV